MAPRSPSSPLTPADVARYHEEGYLVVPGVLDAGRIAGVAAHVEWLQRRHPDLRGEQLHHQLMWEDPFWVRLVADDRLLDLVEPVIGPDIALFASHYIAKPAGDGLPVFWHQDGSYWPLEPMEVITAWLAVDNSTVENGCMRVIPGSHRGPMHEHVDVRGKAAVLHREIEPQRLEEDRAVDIELAPGDVSLHHPLLVHGSNPNRSPRRRCGLTIRYIPTSTRITRDWKSFLLRGRPRPGINTYSPFPDFVPGEHFGADGG